MHQALYIRLVWIQDVCLCIKTFSIFQVIVAIGAIGVDTRSIDDLK